MEIETDDNFFGMEICAELANELVEKYNCEEKSKAIIAADKALLGIFKLIRSMAEVGRKEYIYQICLHGSSPVYRDVYFYLERRVDR